MVIAILLGFVAICITVDYFVRKKRKETANV